MFRHSHLELHKWLLKHSAHQRLTKINATKSSTNDIHILNHISICSCLFPLSKLLCPQNFASWVVQVECGLPTGWRLAGTPRDTRLTQRACRNSPMHAGNFQCCCKHVVDQKGVLKHFMWKATLPFQSFRISCCGASQSTAPGGPTTCENKSSPRQICSKLFSCVSVTLVVRVRFAAIVSDRHDQNFPTTPGWLSKRVCLQGGFCGHQLFLQSTICRETMLLFRLMAVHCARNAGREQVNKTQ